jgi:hypothetical protein
MRETMIKRKLIRTKFILSILFLLFLDFGCSANKCYKLMPFEKEGFWGYENEKKETLIQPEYIMANEFNEYGIAAVVDDSGWVYINKKGEKIIRPLVVDNGPDYFIEGLSRYVDDNKYGFFNEKGHIIIKAEFDYALPFSEGRSAVCNGCKEKKDVEHSFFDGGKWGFINRIGKIVISYQYDSVQSFENNRAFATINDHTISIDRNGKKIKYKNKPL